MAAIVPIVVVNHESRIVRKFRAAGATTPARATTTDAIAVDKGMAFKVLRRHEILRDAGGDRLWLDEPRWQAHEKQRLRFALRWIATILLLLGVAITWIVLAKR